MTAATLSSFDVPFRLAAPSDALLARMIERAPFGAAPAASAVDNATTFSLTAPQPGSSYELRADDAVLADDSDLDTILDLLARDLMVHVANHAPNHVFVHAGVVGWQGCALVFPGASHAGKTTLVAELVRAGATYYSDEYAILDDTARVHPYPRALQMRAPGSDRQTSVTVADLNGSTGSDPLPISHIIFCQYVESGRWNPQPVSPGIAALQMLPHAIPVQRTPARVMATLARIMESATALRSNRGEAAPTARAVLQTVSSEAFA